MPPNFFDSYFPRKVSFVRTADISKTQMLNSSQVGLVKFSVCLKIAERLRSREFQLGKGNLSSDRLRSPQMRGSLRKSMLMLTMLFQASAPKLICPRNKNMLACLKPNCDKMPIEQEQDVHVVSLRLMKGAVRGAK